MPYSVDLKRPDLKGLYDCSACGKVFCHSSSLSRHRIKVHAQNYSCTLCSNQFDSHTKLRQHMYGDHQISKVFMCQCCNNGYPDKTSLYAHTALQRKKDADNKNNDDDEEEDGEILPGNDISSDVSVSASPSSFRPILPRPNVLKVDASKPASAEILSHITSNMQMAALGQMAAIGMMMLQTPNLQDYINYINAINALQTSQNTTSVSSSVPPAAHQVPSMPSQQPSSVSRVSTPSMKTPSTPSRHNEAMSRLSNSLSINPPMLLPMRMTPSPHRIPQQVSQQSGSRVSTPSLISPSRQIQQSGSPVVIMPSTSQSMASPLPSRKRNMLETLASTNSTPAKYSKIETRILSPASRVAQIFSTTPPNEGLLTPKSVFMPPTTTTTDAENNEPRNKRKLSRPRHILSFDDAPAVSSSSAPPDASSATAAQSVSSSSATSSVDYCR